MFFRLGAAAIVAGCSVSDYHPGAKIVQIDGRAFVVSQSSTAPPVYTASPDKPTAAETLGPAWASLAAPNIRAIEAASGCRVTPGTASTTQSGVTVAGVIC
jgi:hypothetical protein